MAASAPAADAASASTANPRVWLDVSVDGTKAGRIVFELYADAVPKCVSPRARTSLIRLRLGLLRIFGRSVRERWQTRLLTLQALARRAWASRGR